jgi:NAD(P)-dependent dehydrogenase (short-subunit alcohol dehydrogenase family)
MTKTMIVTGCSGGFGLSIAVRAAARGWRVLGSVRRDQDGEGLRAAGCDVGICDLCDEESVQDFAHRAVAWAGGSIDCVVHNAGTAFPAPMAAATRADLMAQFEINGAGHFRLNRALLPAAIKAGGTILFISSISTQLPTALLGLYAGSKRALEAMAEALALEVEPLGVRVGVVRPGSYRTDIWATSAARGDEYLQADLNLGEPLDDHYRQLGERVRRMALGQPMGDPAQLARFVVRIAEGAGRWRFYHVTPFSAKIFYVLRRLLPTRLLFRLVRSVMRG